MKAGSGRNTFGSPCAASTCLPEGTLLMCRLTLLCALFLTVLVPEAARAGLPPLIPRKVLFGNPVKASPEISPDGKQLGYLAPDAKDVLQVWVQTVGKDDARQVTHDKKRGIRIFFWAYAPHTLLRLA